MTGTTVTPGQEGGEVTGVCPLSNHPLENVSGLDARVPFVGSANLAARHQPAQTLDAAEIISP